MIQVDDSIWELDGRLELTFLCSFPIMIISPPPVKFQILSFSRFAIIHFLTGVSWFLPSRSDILFENYSMSLLMILG